MIDELKLIRGSDFVINENITIHHPTLDEIFRYGEKRYWSLVQTICAIPSDYMVELNKIGKDYEEITSFQLFYLTTRNFSVEDTRILFGDLDFQKLEIGINTINNTEVYFYNDDFGNQIVIDESIYRIIVEFISKINYIKKRKIKAANKHTKEYLLEKEKRRQKRRKSDQFESIFLTGISSLVNSEGFKYDYDTIWNLPVFLFFDALNRIGQIKNYSNIMTGIYSGSIDPKGIDLNSISWSSKIS